MNILFTAKIPEKHHVTLSTTFPEQSFIFSKSIEEAEHYLSNTEILVMYSSGLTESMIEKAANLKWIMALSAGLEKMPLAAIARKNILVTNARGIHKIPMAEYAISMLLQVYRQEKIIIANERNKHWDNSVRVQEISGKTMLVAGSGSIGQEVARLAKAFRMKTIGISRSGRPLAFFDKIHTVSEMENVLPEADFVVSVLPSTAETKYFFTYEHFELLPSHAVFLNMGRGDAVKTADLLKAVQQEEIAHVVLDVFEEEPLPANHPFWQEENITITPHMSGLSPHYVTRALEIFHENLHTYLEGKNDFRNKIDLARGY